MLAPLTTRSGQPAFLNTAEVRMAAGSGEGKLNVTFGDGSEMDVEGYADDLCLVPGFAVLQQVGYKGAPMMASVAVNLALVRHIQESDGGSLVTFRGMGLGYLQIRVRETPQEVMRLAARTEDSE